MIKKILFALMLFAGISSGNHSIDISAQEAEEADKTLSPYFFVNSDDPDVDALPLQSTSAQVHIAGVIADVTVTQVYKNEGRKTLEAVYIFPGSTRAAVYGMKMTIGERTIVAKIEKREEARQQYEQAKQEGKTASLLEQQRPNVFQMNVANILPGDKIVVELSYTELLVPTDGVYEFAYPTVVGPRYSNQPVPSVPASEQWVENPYLHEGEAPSYNFDMTVNLSTGLPIQQASCPTHQVDIEYESQSFATVKLDDSEKAGGGNRDYILKYQLAGGQIETGLLLYQADPAREGNQENFFLLMAQPPKRVKASDIPRREYIFIVDVSGSMRGFPLDISKKLLTDLIGKLNQDEKFNVLLFAGGSALFSERGSVSATKKNIAKALQFIDRQQGGGGTEILPALQRALALPRLENTSRTVVIMTDGYVNVEAQTFDLIRNKLGDANMFAFGIGTSVNRFLIEGMARMGMGEPFVITEPGAAPAQAEKFRQYIQAPVLTQIHLDVQGFETYDVEPLSIPDVLAERPVIVFGKWRGDLKGTLVLTGVTGSERYTQSFNVGEMSARSENAALRYLWARHRLHILSDYAQVQPGDKLAEMMTDIGLRYNLLTQYTSFVAIDSEIRHKDGDSTTIRQPLPLPQGVADTAVSQAGMQMAVRKTKFGSARNMFKLLTPSAKPIPMSSSGDTAAEAAADKEQDENALMKTVGSKTFILHDKTWIDRQHTPKAALITIKRDSQAYRDLLKAIPDLQIYCELGEKVIVNIGKYSVKIADNGKTTLTQAELQELVRAFQQS